MRIPRFYEILDQRFGRGTRGLAASNKADR